MSSFWKKVSEVVRGLSIMFTRLMYLLLVLGSVGRPVAGLYQGSSDIVELTDKSFPLPKDTVHIVWRLRQPQSHLGLSKAKHIKP